MNQKKYTIFFSLCLMVFMLSSVTAKAITIPTELSADIKLLRVEDSSHKEVNRTVQINESNTTTVSSFSSASSVSSASETLGPNLIANPSFEASNTSATGWNKGGYGTNTRVFSFPEPGFNSPNAIKVAVSSYTSGDAKWFFNDVPVTPGETYQFSDYYISDATSIVDVRYKMADGSFSYTDIATLPPSSSYANREARFIVPPGVVSLTIFHLLNQAGSLTTDEYSLNKVTQSSSGPTSLVPNGDFEIGGTNGNPNGWLRGGWGTNNRTFSYPVAGVNGSKAAQVQIDSFTSGDAKWYFTPLSLSPGVYSYTDTYKSNEPSLLTVQYKNSDGTFSYKDIATLPASANFVDAHANFSVPANVQNVTIFHLIKGLGFLTIDNAILEAQSAPTGIFTTGAVTLTFDDGLLSQYQIALPKLNSVGIPGTFFIISRQLADYGFPGSMSIAQIKSIYASGHEIAAHTRTHPDLTQLTPTQQQDEIAGGRQDLLALNVGPILSFAYPYGAYDATTIQIVKDAGLASARSTIGGYASQTSSRYQLPRQGVEVTTTAAQVKQWIDTAIANKQWLILTFHGIDNSGTQYSTTPDTFNQIIDYLVAKNAKVVTLSAGANDVSQ